MGNNLSKDKLGYDSRLSKSQIDELKAEGIGPGDQEYDMYLRNMGLNPNNLKIITILIWILLIKMEIHLSLIKHQ